MSEGRAIRGAGNPITDNPKRQLIPTPEPVKMEKITAPPTLSDPSPVSLERIRETLEAAYTSYIVPEMVRTGHLKDLPDEYWTYRVGNPDSASPDLDGKMDWAGWEQAVSLLDEAIKAAWAAVFVMDAASVAAFTDIYQQWLPGNDVPYVAPHAVPVLYYAHFFSARAGLASCGVIRLKGRFVVRKRGRAIRWAPGDGVWKERDSCSAQKEILQAYDWCQSKVYWLPERTGAQRGLRQVRDDYTYNAERAGTGSYTRHLAAMKTLIQDHARFSKRIFTHIDVMAKPCAPHERAGVYSPSARISNLRTRLDGLARRVELIE